MFIRCLRHFKFFFFFLISNYFYSKIAMQEKVGLGVIFDLYESFIFPLRSSILLFLPSITLQYFLLGQNSSEPFEL